MPPGPPPCRSPPRRRAASKGSWHADPDRPRPRPRRTSPRAGSACASCRVRPWPGAPEAPPPRVPLHRGRSRAARADRSLPPPVVVHGQARRHRASEARLTATVFTLKGRTAASRGDIRGPASMERPCSRSTAATAPARFEDVVGQEHIVRTLRNAIELDKVHHAYLFVGSRGTGKTSMAKLLACALNAEGGPTAEFDPESEGARAILSGSSIDVVEMDAASNNSVDDIRELRENVAQSPMGGHKRVYILDEAHMLSQAAWNAFLKTLEEPPSHVVFVLATTEAHKVPATIVDRCHRFDFRRPSLEQIAKVLDRVAAQEDIQLPEAAVGMLARSATGSFRDALGTLEQLVTYGGSRGTPRGRARHPGRGRRRAGAGDGRGPGRPRPQACAARRQAALRFGPRLHPVHARPLRAPATPVRRADAGRGARLLLRHLRADGTAVLAGRSHRPGGDPAGDRLPCHRPRRGEGRVRAAHPARDGPAEGHPAAGRPLGAGADRPDRAARVGEPGARRGRAPAAPAPPASPRLRLPRRERPASPPPAARGLRTGEPRLRRAEERPRRWPWRPRPHRARHGAGARARCWPYGPRWPRRWPRRTGCWARRWAPRCRWRSTASA